MRDRSHAAHDRSEKTFLKVVVAQRVVDYLAARTDRNTSRHPEKVAAIMFQLTDRLADIVQGKVCRRLLDPGQDVGRPAPCEFLDGTDVEIAVMEEPLEGRHLAREKPAILTDAVATHRRCSSHCVLRQEIQRPRLRVLGRDAAVTDPLQQTGAAVRGPVPFVHRTEHGGVLVDRNHGPFRHYTERRVGDDRRDLDDVIGLRVQAGHLEVDPDQVVSFQGVAGRCITQRFE